MKQIKKLTSFLLTSILFMLSFTSNATSLQSQNKDSNFYVKSLESPKEVIEYAKENAGRFILSLRDDLNINVNEFSMLTPFTLAEKYSKDTVFNFPIMHNNNIEFLFSVGYNEKKKDYSCSLSSHLASKLSNLFKQSSKENPLTLFIKNGNLYYNINNKTSLLFQYHNDNKNNDTDRLQNNIDKANDLKIINISKEIPFPLETKTNLKASSYKYISLSRTEQQGSVPWCAAYAAAAIIRTVNDSSSPVAKDIIKHFYPNSSNLTEKSITDSKVNKYGKYKGFSTKYKTSTLSHTKVKAEINASRPIYIATYGSGHYKKGRHALALRGYNDNYDSYSVWNPWDKSSYDLIDQDDKILYVSDGSFTWDRTVYNWR